MQKKKNNYTDRQTDGLLILSQKNYPVTAATATVKEDLSKHKKHVHTTNKNILKKT